MREWRSPWVDVLELYRTGRHAQRCVKTAGNLIFDNSQSSSCRCHFYKSSEGASIFALKLIGFCVC